MTMLLKCVSGAVKILRIPKFGICVPSLCIFLLQLCMKSSVIEEVDEVKNNMKVSICTQVEARP